MSDQPASDTPLPLKENLKVHFDAAILCGELGDTDVGFIVDVAEAVAMQEITILRLKHSRYVVKLHEAVDALAVRCGFPKSDDYAQMLGTVGNKVERLTAENARLQADLARCNEERDMAKETADKLRPIAIRHDVAEEEIDQIGLIVGCNHAEGLARCVRDYVDKLTTDLDDARRKLAVAEKDVADLKAREDRQTGSWNTLANCADTLRARDFGTEYGAVDERVIAMAKALDEARQRLAAAERERDALRAANPLPAESKAEPVDGALRNKLRDIIGDELCKSRLDQDEIDHHTNGLVAAIAPLVHGADSERLDWILRQCVVEGPYFFGPIESREDADRAMKAHP